MREGLEERKEKERSEGRRGVCVWGGWQRVGGREGKKGGEGKEMGGEEGRKEKGKKQGKESWRMKSEEKEGWKEGEWEEGQNVCTLG